MLKRRLIPVLYIMNGFIVRSETFDTHQILGNVISEARRYNEWDVDELIYIDISRTKNYDFRRDDHRVQSMNSMETIIQQISTVCFMPLTFGGTIRRIEDIDLRIQNGADKIVLNTGSFNNPSLIDVAAKKYGAQCVVQSIDYRIIDDQPIVFTEWGSHNTNTSVFDWIRQVEDHGAGEIFLNSIDRDGLANGYDIPTLKIAAEQTLLPVIGCGGAGDVYDFVDLAEQTSVSGIAAGNLFHFTERAYPRAKNTLRKNKVNVR